jgi:transcription initiation factor TFIID subunit 13
MEPRARATRHKGSLNFGPELESMLYGFGAPMPPSISSINPKPNSETVRVLDEIVTDFIIETCHNAVAIASYSGRTKLKLEDFQWVIRKDPTNLGRVKAKFEAKRQLDKDKKLPGVAGDGDGAKLAVDDMEALAAEAGEEGTGKGKGRGRGRGKRKKRDIAHVDGADDEDDGEYADRSIKKARSARSETG